MKKCANSGGAEIAYPAEFHFRIICDAAVDVSVDIYSAAAEHKITGDMEESKRSRSGKFCSYGISIVFKDRAAMQRFDETVKAIPGVRMLL